MYTESPPRRLFVEARLCHRLSVPVEAFPCISTVSAYCLDHVLPPVFNSTYPLFYAVVRSLAAPECWKGRPDLCLRHRLNAYSGSMSDGVWDAAFPWLDNSNTTSPLEGKSKTWVNSSPSKNAVQVELEHRIDCAWATFRSLRQESTSPKVPTEGQTQKSSRPKCPHHSSPHQERGR